MQELAGGARGLMRVMRIGTALASIDASDAEARCALADGAGTMMEGGARRVLSVS
jgi:hypothetical protein